MRKRTYIIASILFIILIGFLAWYMRRETSHAAANAADKTWHSYLGGPHRNHYSSLNQINTANVKKLKVAWTYSTQDTGEMETNPIIIGDTLYGMTAGAEPFAINAATGKKYWQRKGKKANDLNTSRGLAYWSKGRDHRILFTHGQWLYALNTETGKTIPSFGDSGRVSLKTGLDESAGDKMVSSTTPGTIYKNLIIMPLRVSESAGAAKGYIQAFNVKTGKLAWVFHTVPRPGKYGYSTWPKNAYKNPNIGGVNCWTGMAIDRKRGIVYVPTGSPAFDFYGGNRKGRDLFSSSLLALNAKTGKRIWDFQFVHHDILDRDLPAPPNLLTVTHNGKRIPAVAQITKYGYIYLFNRVTGKPLFPIKEKSVPPSPLSGEQTWPTQPLPVKPAPFARHTLTKNDINPYAKNRKELEKIFRHSRYNGPFTPLGEQSTIVFPGFDGGGEWGGAAADPSGILYVNSNQIAWCTNLAPTDSEKKMIHLSLGHRLFNENCSRCHGADLKGHPKSGFPSLANIRKHYSKEFVTNVISNGRGMMPSFDQKLSSKQKQAIVAFLFGEMQKKTTKVKVARSKQSEKEKPTVPYKFMGYNKFLTEDGYPAIRPPWGTLDAINLNTGKYVWKDTLGTHPKLAAKGIPKTGSQNYGGPLVTAGNLLFIAATPDAMFKAFDKRNGKLLWMTRLPAAGFATPSTYEVNGKQYVVIACGGTKLGTPGGQSYVAFTLSK
ncbi:MAG TPA: PQQ-binding-like beta-propeller repeat protein [Balneolaceae bacterium]|nr:PQQ-binding-like beta-propeller repeat protein [Balneolaceae bacterium]